MNHRLPPTASFVLLLLAATAQGLAPITPSPNLPATTPWDLQQLSAPPSFEWVDATGSVRSLFYGGEPFGGQPTRVFAYYATPGSLAGDPTKDVNLPAVVLVHGGGGTAFREWAELWARRGYAAIAMDLGGHRPIEGKNAHQGENRTRLPDGGPDQDNQHKFDRIAEPVTEQWPYHAVAAVLRAHSLIRSFAEVDPERTAVTGISWGGYLTSIVAGVDSRFKAAVPVYGCGFLYENSAWTEGLNKMSPDQRDRWITLWDPSRYLPAVSMPILFVNGTNDFAYPLDSYMKSFDAVPDTKQPDAKQLCVTVNMPHGHPPGWAPQEIGLFVDQHLLGSPGLPVVGDPRIEAGQARVPYTSSIAISRAELHFTLEDGAINKRAWQTQPAQLADGEIVASPPAAATAWFLTVVDERGAVVSSRVVLRDDEQAEVSRQITDKLQAGSPVRIVCFGDSVTGVYYHTGGRRAYTDMIGIALRQAYPSANVTMINAGISGHTTRDALARIDQDVLARQPTLVTVMFGLNDITRVPLPEYRENLQRIVNQCRSVGAEVLLCTPNNVISTEGRPAETLEAYCAAVRDVGRSARVPVCDCYRELQEVRGRDGRAWRLLMSDEIHPNMAGHKRLAEQIVRSITGRVVSLDAIPPAGPALAKTRAGLAEHQPLRVLAMPPLDAWIVATVREAAPDAQLEIWSWPTENLTLQQLEQDAQNRVRALKPNLVVLAVPRSATADSTESFIHGYAWIMNWSLSFGQQEWDCVVVHPTVTDAEHVDAEHDDLVRQLVAAQDLTLIDRPEGSSASAQEIWSDWLRTQLSAPLEH